MEETENTERREEIFSEVVRAGKRTYFFDVKETRNKERYLTITESKRRFNNESGKFFYEKHKLFLYKEDFEKFSNGLRSVIDFIESGKSPEPQVAEEPEKTEPETPSVADLPEVKFEDLDAGETTEETKTEE
jgi:hypothetical protein